MYIVIAITAFFGIIMGVIITLVWLVFAKMRGRIIFDIVHSEELPTPESRLYDTDNDGVDTPHNTD